MLLDALAAKVAAGDVPPHLRRGTFVERCGLCLHFDSVNSECVRHGWPVRASEVCDDFHRAGWQGLPSGFAGPPALPSDLSAGK